MGEESEKLTVTQFAEIAGVTHQAVSAAIKSGRLTAFEETRNGRVLIDRERGLDEFKNGRRRMPRNRKSTEAIANESITEYERRQKFYAAELARLKFEQQSGRLLDADQVSKAAFRSARATRDALISIPDRLAAELAGETDQFIVHRRLTEEIRQALENLSEQIQQDEPEPEESRE